MLRLQSCQVNKVLAMTLYLESHKYMSVLQHFLKSIMQLSHFFCEWQNTKIVETTVYLEKTYKYLIYN